MHISFFIVSIFRIVIIHFKIMITVIINITIMIIVLIGNFKTTRLPVLRSIIFFFDDPISVFLSSKKEFYLSMSADDYTNLKWNVVYKITEQNNVTVSIMLYKISLYLR